MLEYLYKSVFRAPFQRKRKVGKTEAIIKTGFYNKSAFRIWRRPLYSEAPKSTGATRTSADGKTRY
jgi:hypothetical protein